MWVLIRSWHIVDQTRIGFTFCGRHFAVPVTMDPPPPEAKTCESCFRARERRQP